MLPRPPITAMATSANESSTRKNLSVKPIVTTSPPRSAPPSPATNPPSAYAVSFARTGDTVNASAACSFSRTPMIVRPMPLRRSRPTTIKHDHEHRQREVVVAEVLVREVERPDVLSGEAHRLTAERQDRLAEDVDLRGDGEGQRAGREHQPAHAQRRHADERRGQARDHRAEEQRPAERHRRNRPR